MLFSAAVSLEDWEVMFGTWGKPGVYKILKELKENGVSRVYWRTLGAGQSAYPSRITEPITEWWSGEKLYDPATAKVLGIELKELITDFGAYDHQACARDLARKMGIEFYLWHESHMESHSGQYSQFILRHPEFRAINRWREALAGHLSWGFKETIDRRLCLFKEALAYEPDGIALDLLKGGDHQVPRVDQHGYCAIGYEEPVLEAFEKKTGKSAFDVPNTDMDWVRFRASYVTEFMREVRQYQRRLYPNVRMGLFAAHAGRIMGTYPNDEPYIPRSPRTDDPRTVLYALLADEQSLKVGLAGPLEGNLEDVDTWLEGRLFDFVDAAIVAVPRYVEGALDTATYRQRIEESREIVAGRVPFGTQLGSWSVSHEHIVEGARTARETGCEEIVLFESQGIEANRNWGAVKEAVSTFGR